MYSEIDKGVAPLGEEWAVEGMVTDCKQGGWKAEVEKPLAGSKWGSQGGFMFMVFQIESTRES